MTRFPPWASSGALALALTAACAASACGREGALERPGPLFGLPRSDLSDPAADGRVQRAAPDTLTNTVEGVGGLTSPTAALDRPIRLALLDRLPQDQPPPPPQADPAPEGQPVKTQRDGATPTSGTRQGVHSNDPPDDAPVTNRDIRDPSQRLTPLSASPIRGIPDPLGPPVSTQPPD